MKMKRPKYVCCIKRWDGKFRKSVMGMIYNTDIPNSFSAYTWDQMYGRTDGAGNPIEYFQEATEEDWNKQEGLSSKNNYPIF